MIVSAGLESELVLKLFKDFSKDYNPGNIAKEVGKTRIGTFKALRSLEKKHLVKSKPMGRARFYSFDFTSLYARKTAELLLMDESDRHRRWVEEFKEIFGMADIAILFGSSVRNSKDAGDIDLMLVYSKGNDRKIDGFIRSKNETLIKKVHLLKQTKEDLKKNLRKRDSVVLDAIRRGVVLHGYEAFVELMGCVAGQE